MNNLERIKKELEQEARRVGHEIDMAPEQFLEVVLEIVSAEDEHRISRTNINQQVRTIIENAAVHNND